MNRPELNEEIRLFRTGRERERHENEAELYAVLNTLESLEKAYIRDCVGSKEYTAACQKLLVQCKASFRLVTDGEFPTIEDFAKKYRMNCPAAMSRIAEGRPITIRDNKGKGESASIATVVSLFITIMDKLKLEIRAVDDLQPDLRDLHDTLLRMTSLSADFEGGPKVAQWLSVMDAMKASDELTEEQTRQMVFDIESSYAAFNRCIQNG